MRVNRVVVVTRQVRARVVTHQVRARVATRQVRVGVVTHQVRVGVVTRQGAGLHRVQAAGVDLIPAMPCASLP